MAKIDFVQQLRQEVVGRQWFHGIDLSDCLIIKECVHISENMDSQKVLDPCTNLCVKLDAGTWIQHLPKLWDVNQCVLL